MLITSSSMSSRLSYSPLIGLVLTRYNRVMYIHAPTMIGCAKEAELRLLSCAAGCGVVSNAVATQLSFQNHSYDGALPANNIRSFPPAVLMSSPYHRRYSYLKRDEQLSKSWFHKLPVHTQRDPSPVSTSLCFGCDSLDLPGIVARMRADPKMKDFALPPWTNSAGVPMNDGACALCAIFSANWDREGAIDIEWMESMYYRQRGMYSPWSPAALVFSDSEWTNKTVFEIIPTKDNHLDSMSRLLDPSSVDFDRIRLWLQYCSNDDVAPQPRRKSAYLPGFRLIHCRSRKIIKPPQECRYVALSYVWGKNPPEESQSQCFPRTIEDAIKVCLELGFEYICTFGKLRRHLSRIALTMPFFDLSRDRSLRKCATKLL